MKPSSDRSSLCDVEKPLMGRILVCGWLQLAFAKKTLGVAICGFPENNFVR